MTSTLKRSLSLPHMVLYGLGTTIGAGIYALVGEISAASGYLAPAAFFIASLLASLTALSFAELSGRYPQAAGAALYTQKGFHSTHFAFIVGLMVCLAGIVSCAALINAFVGYLQVYLELDRMILITIMTVMVGGIAAWGISESVTLAALITLIEIGGLLLIIYICKDSYTNISTHWQLLVPSTNINHWLAISSGAILAFYAFIGFEDMVEVAEEVQDVKRTLPLAILLTISITTIVYLLIMLGAILSLSPEIIAASATPLSLLYEIKTGNNSNIINIIGMVAIINGSIIQMIMASRVIYGLSSRNHLPAIFKSIHPRTQTPVISTALIIVIVLCLALIGRLSSLAELTSLIVLVTFSIVNLALWRIKKHTHKIEGVICVPRWLPLLGFLSCLGFVLIQLYSFI
jgi:amino acid transporter